jgi:hypothetical protein
MPAQGVKRSGRSEAAVSSNIDNSPRVKAGSTCERIDLDAYSEALQVHTASHPVHSAHSNSTFVLNLFFARIKEHARTRTLVPGHPSFQNSVKLINLILIELFFEGHGEDAATGSKQYFYSPIEIHNLLSRCMPPRYAMATASFGHLMNEYKKGVLLSEPGKKARTCFLSSPP